MLLIYFMFAVLLPLVCVVKQRFVMSQVKGYIALERSYEVITQRGGYNTVRTIYFLYQLIFNTSQVINSFLIKTNDAVCVSACFVLIPRSYKYANDKHKWQQARWINSFMHNAASNQYFLKKRSLVYILLYYWSILYKYYKGVLLYKSYTRSIQQTTNRTGCMFYLLFYSVTWWGISSVHHCVVSQCGRNRCRIPDHSWPSLDLRSAQYSWSPSARRRYENFS